MKLNWICGVVFAIALTIPAAGQIGVYIGGAPPPLRYERRGPTPGPGLRLGRGVLGPGMGTTTGGWQGVGTVRPTKGAYWNHPHYDHYREGWRMHEGHWDSEESRRGSRTRRGSPRSLIPQSLRITESVSLASSYCRSLTLLPTATRKMALLPSACGEKKRVTSSS